MKTADFDFDLPDSHIALANAVLDQVTPNVLLLEKPDLENW